MKIDWLLVVLYHPSIKGGYMMCTCSSSEWELDSSLQVGMKTDGNGRENLSTISVSVFYDGKRERERNSRVRERKRDITVTEMGGNRKIYRNALLFNHHSFCMNITLDTLLHKLFFKNMINISCFLRLKREIYLLMLRNMRGYMVCLFIFFWIL